MFSITYGAHHNKLKAHLRLAVSRLKTVEKKKTEANNKARAEIAQLLAENKPDRARIRVEHIIREDNLIEAYEMLELFCELLLARYGVIEHKKKLDSSIAEAVLSILWAVPRMATEIPEFKILGDQLTMKYGKAIAQAAVDNKLEAPLQLSPVLLKKVSICTPEKILKERYLIVIAQKYNVDFKPDLEIVGEDEVSLGEMMLAEFCAAKPLPSAPETVEEKHDIGWKSHATDTHLAIGNPNFSDLLDTSINSLVTDSNHPSLDHNKPAPLDDSYFDNMMMKLNPPKTTSDTDFEDLMRRFDHLKKR